MRATPISSRFFASWRSTKSLYAVLDIPGFSQPKYTTHSILINIQSTEFNFESPTHGNPSGTAELSNLRRTSIPAQTYTYMAHTEVRPWSGENRRRMRAGSNNLPHPPGLCYLSCLVGPSFGLNDATPCLKSYISSTTSGTIYVRRTGKQLINRTQLFTVRARF